jgi:hypothetical protein
MSLFDELVKRGREADLYLSGLLNRSSMTDVCVFQGKPGDSGPAGLAGPPGPEVRYYPGGEHECMFI